MKYFYQGNFDPEKLHPLNIDCQAVFLVPEKSRVLEIGCANGFMGNYLIKNKKCSVFGVEMDKEVAEKAKERGLVVITGDIEKEETLNKLKKEEKFQVILCTSVIEHLKDPGKALRNWRSFLSNEGLLIVSTPNIGHFSARIEILLGNFPSHDYGIFDENHLHFFTLKSFQRLIKKNGFNLEHLGIDPIGGGWPKISRFLSLFFPGLFAYQIIIKAKKASDKLF